jgi:hypothetical protein
VSSKEREVGEWYTGLSLESEVLRMRRNGVEKFEFIAE